MFLRQSRKLVDIMQRASLNERRDLAHTLKGSARAVGAFEVAEAAEELEVALGRPAGTDAALLQLEQAVVRAHRAIVGLTAKLP